MSPPRGRQARDRSTAKANSKPELWAHRVRFALERLDAGDAYSAARTAIASKFGVSRATATRDLTRAYEEIAEDVAREAPQLAARTHRRLWRMSVAAEREGDYKAAVAALDRFCRVAGLYAPTTTKVQVSGGMTLEQEALLGALQLTPAERQKRIAELEGAGGESAAATGQTDEEADDDR